MINLVGFQFVVAEKSVLRPLNQNQLSKGNVYRDRSYKSSSPLVPKVQFLQYPSIKCTAHYKRSYIELDDEMISVITEVEGTFLQIHIFCSNSLFLLQSNIFVYLFV